jgi:RHS repeat-associated protein
VNQKFTGQERDTETGLDFFQARYFSGALGRFNSPDPGNAGASLFNPQSWNGYTYVNNNPLVNVDPSGASCINGQEQIVPESDGAAQADNGDGMGCLTAGVRPGDPNDPRTLNQGQTNAEVTGEPGSWPSAVLWNATFAMTNASNDYFSFIAPKSQLLSPTPNGSGGLANIGAGIGIAVTFIGPGEEASAAKGLLSTTRSRLLQSAQSSKLRKLINYLYRPGATVGTGSTADAIREELATGNLLSPRGHFLKAQEARTSLQRLYRDPSTISSDRRIIKEILADLQNALSGR